MDLHYIWGVISHLLKSDWANLYQLPVFQPQPDMLTSCHTLFGLFPFFKLFQLLGFDILSSHNLYLISALYLGALGSYLLLRELGHPRWLSFTFGFFWLVWTINPIHFIWLNFLSAFWAPFSLFFLVRWHKSPSWISGFLAAFCAGMLFAANEYYGIHFLAFLVPPVILYLLYLNRKQKNMWPRLILPMLLIGLLILLLYGPLLQAGIRASSTPDSEPTSFRVLALIGAHDLFAYSHPLSSLFPNAVYRGHHLFLGFGFGLLLLSFFAAPYYKAKLIWAILFGLYCLGALSYFLSPLLLLLTVLSLLSCSFILFLMGRHEYDGWERLAAWVSSLFLLILWGMPLVDPQGNLSLYRLIWKHVPGFSALRAFNRVFPILLPFLIIMAAAGIRKMAASKASKRIIAFVGLSSILLMSGENFYLRKQFDFLEPPPLKPVVYRNIPADEYGTLLALPFYSHNYFSRDDNARYMANQHYHNLHLIGGRTSYQPVWYFDALSATVDHGRLNESKMARLIEQHSLSWLVVHWDWLNDLFAELAPELIPEIRESLSKLKEWLRPVYQDENSSVFEVIDPRENTVFKRVFSLPQLLKKEIEVQILSGGGEFLHYWIEGEKLAHSCPIKNLEHVTIKPPWLPRKGPVTMYFKLEKPGRINIKPRLGKVIKP